MPEYLTQRTPGPGFWNSSSGSYMITSCFEDLNWQPMYCSEVLHMTRKFDLIVDAISPFELLECSSVEILALKYDSVP